MARKTSAQLIRDTREAMEEASVHLTHGEREQAIQPATQAFKSARAQRSFGLLSSAWMFLLDTYATDPDAVLSMEYREYVEGAFSWAETMPEEIQVWFFPALVPHLERLAFRRLVDRARTRIEAAQKWLAAGNMNVRTRVQEFHVEDLAAGRTIDPNAIAMERMATLYVDELFDPTGATLDQAASLWRSAGRGDRAEFLEALAVEVRSRTPHG